jgi:phospholipase C
MLLFLGLLAGCAGQAQLPPFTSHPAGQLHPGKHIQTVFLIVMENHNWSDIKGSFAAPYINRTLLPQASYATQYYNPPGLHPSLPNYLWLEAGTNCFPGTGCIRDDDDPASHPIRSHAHLVTLLELAGISWRAYEEDVNGKRCPLSTHTSLQALAEAGVPGLGSNLYAAKHDPFVYFDDVTNGQSPSSPVCIAHVRPFSQLATDLRQNTVARYNFITPNVCDDMHSHCPLFSNQIHQGDTWLSRVVPAIQASRAYVRGGALFITWDEGRGGDGPIGLILLSPFARGHGYANAIHYTHSSLLRTVEEIFGVHPFLGSAARAADLRDLFRRFP